MMGTKFEDIPSSADVLKSKYTIDDIRHKISYLFETDEKWDTYQLAVLELVLCLANEIHELRSKLDAQ